MARRRLLFALLWPTGLVVLMSVLAFFQYKWLGQVSEAEDSRLRRTLNQRAGEFADDFDRDLSRAYLALQLDGESINAHRWESFARRYDSWRESARFPQIVRTIYFTQPADASTTAPAPSTPLPGLMKFDPAARTFSPTDWPDSLALVKRMFTTFSHPTAGTSGPAGAVRFISVSVMSDVPALLIPIQLLDQPLDQSMKRMIETAARSVMTFSLGSAYVVVELDREFIVNSVLPALVERHFPAGEYRVEITDANWQGKAVFTSGLAAGATIDAKTADATVPFFAVRLEGLRDVMTFRTSSRGMGFSRGSGTVVPAPARGAAPSASGQVSIFLDQRTAPGGAAAADVASVARSMMPFGSVQVVSGWQLRLQHPTGSLKAAVTRTRSKNLALSFGVLALLAVSVFLITINAERAERLAAQQMDFVATVSHELRTPLAVIRSAAQNLSAGVVHEPAQAKRYGDLIDSEGRRLTDMVEQVLTYAGLSDSKRPATTTPTDIVWVTRDVLESCRSLINGESPAEGLSVSYGVVAEEGLPDVPLDESAFRSALNNLIVNAVKYGSGREWLGIEVKRGVGRNGQPEVQVSVSDRGRGIDAEELPHVFEAFYRGKFVKDQQIHGNGLGLSLVKRIAEVHGGRVTVKSAPGAGSTFTLHLPA